MFPQILCCGCKPLIVKIDLVARKKHFVVYFLISLFGLLFLKNIYFAYLGQNVSHCDEVGHVHFKKNLDDHCRSTGSILSEIILNETVYFIFSHGLGFEFQIKFKIDSNFISPFLEGPRRPPRV